MVQTSEILIGSAGGDHVSIKIGSPNREEWRGAEVEVRCDGWIGRMRASFMKGELGRFSEEIRQLHRKLSGSAELQPLEPNLTLALTGDGKGHVTVDGTARNDFAGGTRLVFRFEIDQTFLDDIADALSDADPMA